MTILNKQSSFLIRDRFDTMTFGVKRLKLAVKSQLTGHYHKIFNRNGTLQV